MGDVLPFPAKRYQIIYADPPWSFLRGAWGGSVKQPTHYPRMHTSDIMALPVGELAERNSLLFLWTTSSHLLDALEVMQAWGFKYNKIGFVWIKTRQDGQPICGLGALTRNACEFCLIGVRGKGVPQKDKTIRQLVIAPRRAHSQKPPEVRKRIECLFGEVPRIELFARERVPGWDAWGNEVHPPAGKEECA